MVPKFETYSPSEESMNSNQRNFYKKLEFSLNRGEFLDVAGNISYVFVYLYKLLDKWNEMGFENLYEFLIYLSELYYHETKLSEYCLFWAHDCLLGLKKYDEYLEKTEPKEPFGTSTQDSNLRLNIQKKLNMEANFIDIILISGGKKTKFRLNNLGVYKDKIGEVFRSYASDKGGWFYILENWVQEKNLVPHSLFDGYPGWEIPELEFKIICYYAAYSNLAKIHLLCKEAENLAREEIGVPKIGEGWISETMLFKKLEKEFFQTKVVQHGQPKWLGLQHFDIWFPNWKIAVEYHGRQHFEPVEFFGGEEAFNKRKELDKRKENLAKQNDVKLFIVTENDEDEILINNIKKFIASRRIIPPIA